MRRAGGGSSLLASPYGLRYLALPTGSDRVFTRDRVSPVCARVERDHPTGTNRISGLRANHAEREASRDGRTLDF